LFNIRSIYSLNTHSETFGALHVTIRTEIKANPQHLVRCAFINKEGLTIRSVNI